MNKKIILSILGGVIVISGISYGGYSYLNLRKANSQLTSSISELRDENLQLSLELGSTTAAFEALSGQIDGITSTVGNLEKLKSIDPELLKKYSKVFFLSDNYMPKGLTKIDQKYIYPAHDLYFLGQAYSFLTKLIDDANASGLTLRIDSAYRSYDTQSDLKSAYRVTYGAGTANSFSADQGYSEHQLGTAVDFATQSTKGVLAGFQKTPEYAWLIDNAYKYGFVLSYPPNNSYYIYEPWHWRFVGIKLATRLYIEHENFYELDQRQIDPYLITLFDQN